MSSRPPPKKPSGGRPNLRKLISKDSLSSLASFSKHGRESSQSDVAEHSGTRRKAQQATLPPLTEDQDSMQPKTPWMNDELVSSPITAKEDHDPFEERAAAMNTQSVKLTSSRPMASESLPMIRSSEKSAATASPEFAASRSSLSSSPPPMSPSKLRWDQLRQHVLPTQSVASSPNPSFTSFSQLNLPAPISATPRPTTPRPSRFATRFGFRQVVNEAREVADDLTRRLADDIHKACWAVRFGDSKPSKPEREASQPSTLGSTLHLPFMSSPSLPLSNNASSNNLSVPSSFRHGLRGATSMANLTVHAGSRMGALANLQAIITRYASLSMQENLIYGILPHEKDVLSVLLIAFLGLSSGQDVDDERQVSLEIFETVIRRWKAPQPEANVDRCLWCCKAATAPALNLRTRILYLLNSILSSEDSPLTSSLALQTIIPSLSLVILHCQISSPSRSVSSVEDSNDLLFLHELIGRIFAGGCGHLDLDDLEQKCQALVLKTDSEDDLRQGVCVGALAKCLEFGMPDERRATLGIVEKYWALPDPSKSSTPLRSKIHLSKIIAFLRPILSMLRDSLDASGASKLDNLDYRIMTQLLIGRVLPEVDCLTSSDDLLNDARSLAVKVALTLLGSGVDDEDVDDTFTDLRHPEVRNITLDWLNGKSTAWRETLQKELKAFASSAEWRIDIPIAYRLISVLPEGTRKVVVALMIPQFQERMVDDCPSSLHEPLSRLLTSFAAIHPQIFYKPLFVCAVSTKEETIAHQLAILVALTQYMPNFWTTDAEMVSVALMSDPGGGASLGKGKTKEGQPLVWGKARLGQTIVLLELIGKLRSIREDHNKRQDDGMASSVSISKVLKFVTALENRLAILIDAKEQSALLPLSQRTLFSTLFLEIRLLTRSLKSAVWLPRIITWTMQYSEDPEHSSTTLPSLHEDLQDEIDEIWERLEVIYSLTKTSMRPASQRRNTSVMSPRGDISFPDDSSDSREKLVDARLNLLRLLPKGTLSSLLEVLVAMSGALKHDDYSRLGPFVWDKCLYLGETKAVIHACFICMQCAEKAQDRFLSLLLARLQSPSAVVRRTTVQKLNILSSWRFQLLSVTYITDRSYRRPFKLARPPLNFVATDVGDSKYVPDDDLEEVTSGKGHVLPLDIRRRLHEIGWDDEEKPIDQQFEWRRTPMSLLGGGQLDQISSTDNANDDNRFSDHSPSPSPTTSPGNSPSLSTRSEGLLRRNSSSHGRHTGKRRPVFVQPLVAVFVPLAKLALENDISIASVARDLLIDYMRDDPAVLCRPIMEILSGDVESIDNAVTTLRTFLHLSRVLPPRLTHHVFNHLAGFLKFLAKDSSTPGSLHDLALTVPVLAKFAPQVSEISVRAIRRGKIEVFLFPSGTLYFPDSVPRGRMFPRGPEPVVNPFDSCPKSLVDLTMIRMSQSLLFVELLKRSPQDVHVIRKSWTPLVLPDVVGIIDGNDVVPRQVAKRFVPERSKTSFRISLSFSRTHLLFVAQVFRCLTRHLNSREELASWLDGVNRILLRHGDDIGIVAHVLIVYMIASTRFRRLMASGTGFTLFLPALIKIYCEAEGDTGIREAIQYAVHRFFAVHEDVFVYQALQVVSNLVAESSAADGVWISSNVYHLLSTLKSTSSSLYDAAGIRDSNKAQEEETALAITADERPQMFLASLRKESRTSAEKLQSSLSVEIFDSKRFHPDNIIRMLLTVIAHDPTVKRAQYFVRLFRHLVPDLYEASISARNVLKEAIEALGSILSSKASKTKGAENAYSRPGGAETGDETSKENIITSSKLLGNPSSPCDMQVMRSDYLFIFASYVRCGGAHSDVGLHRALDIAKTLLKESSTPPESIDSVRLFLERIGESFGRRQDVKYAITLMKEFAPIISAHGSILDLSGLFKSLTRLCSAPAFANDRKFSNVVVSQICSAALEICEMAAQENVLSTLKFLPALVALLARSVCLIGSDVIAEFERRDPSPAFLCGVVLPFIFQLYTTTELATQTQWTDSWRQDAHARAWVRLLSFAMNAFQNQQSTGTRSYRGSVGRSPSFTSEAIHPFVEVDPETSRGTLKKARRRPSGQGSIVTSVRLAMAFVTLKAVALRGEEDISTVFPGAWLLVAALLRSTLRDGNAIFALRTQFPSAPPSPAISPASSATFAEIIDKSTEKKHRSSSSSTSDVYLAAPSRPSRPSSPTLPPRRNSSQQFPRPRFVDYLAWSLSEFLCLRRSPLSMLMRIYMHERVVPLNEILQADDPITGNASFGSSARKSLRPLSTMYSKPRFRPGSAATTPEASPRLGPSDPSNSIIGNLSSTHRISGLAGLDYSTPSPRRLKGGAAIKYLGISAPPTNAFLSPAFVPVSNLADSLSQSNSAENIGQSDAVVDARQALIMTTLRSPGLVKRTYERVRVVQRCLGYSTFLPIPDALTKPCDAAPSNLGMYGHSAGGPGSMSASASPHTSIIVSGDEEPEVHAWTKKKAAKQLMTEAQELLRAWQMESAITTSASDSDHKEGPTNATEGDVNVSSS